MGYNIRAHTPPEQDILLDLSTDRKREKIAIDGKLYEMQTPQDFQLQEYQWLARKAEHVGAIAAELTPANLPELAKLLDAILVKIMRTKMPRRVLRKLSNNQKTEIMNAFTKAAPIKGETTRPTPRHGKSSSPASSDSMADPSRAGSKPASAL